MNELILGLAIGVFIVLVFVIGYLVSVVANLIRDRFIKRRVESEIKRVKKNGRNYTSGKY